ncbi:MAG TPA: hypothetical protein VIP70_12705 [Nitrososphaeraceae archaeon]
MATVSQRCVIVDGINWYEITIGATGFTPGLNRGGVLVDGTLVSESEFSPNGTILPSTWSGPGGPAFGAGLHNVTAFHDANENRQLDPGEVSATTTFTGITCGPNPCTDQSFRSSDATEMNTITTIRSLVKTIYVEKEVFSCQAEIRPNVFWPIITDVSIYTEIIEGTMAAPPIKKFEVITCNKNATNGDILGCKHEVPSSNLPAVYSCSQFPRTLPVEMNTVVVSPGIVKTIEVEKEVFNCDTPNKPKITKDVIIFTEILENLSTGTSEKTFESVTCLKDIGSAKVIACKATPPIPF